MLLLIDNYDSFAHNLARYLRRFGVEVRVARNDAITVDEIRNVAPHAIVLSPGPCTPNEAGCSLDVVRRFHESLPILGVCLGHQTIAAAFGASIIRAEVPMHGRTSVIEHDCQGVFNSLPSPLIVGRYHSLVVDERTLPAELCVSARTEDGIVMALRHRELPIVGLQFHPESILTEHGYRMLGNFLCIAGIVSAEQIVSADRPSFKDELRIETGASPPIPSVPITF